MKWNNSNEVFVLGYLGLVLGNLIFGDDIRKSGEADIKPITPGTWRWSNASSRSKSVSAIRPRLGTTWNSSDFPRIVWTEGVFYSKWQPNKSQCARETGGNQLMGSDLNWPNMSPSLKGKIDDSHLTGHKPVIHSCLIERYQIYADNQRKSSRLATEIYWFRNRTQRPQVSGAWNGTIMTDFLFMRNSIVLFQLFENSHWAHWENISWRTNWYLSITVH